MRALTFLFLFAAAGLSHAAAINWTEYDANGLQIANGSLVTVCDYFLDVHSSCSEPVPISVTATHFSFSASSSSVNLDALNTLLVATATVTSRDGTRGTLNITWDQNFRPAPGYLYDPFGPISVIDSYVMTGGFALSSPDAGDTIVANKLQNTVLGGISFNPLTASASDGPSFSIGPDTQSYAPNVVNGLQTSLSVDFNFLGASIVTGDAMDIPVSSSTSTPEPCTAAGAIGALGILIARRRSRP